ALEVQGVRPLEGDDPRISLPVFGVEHIAAPLVVAGLGGAVHDHGPDLAFSALILDRDDLTAQLAPAIIEIDLRAGRWPHPRSERIVRLGASNKYSGKSEYQNDPGHQPYRFEPSLTGTAAAASFSFLIAHRVPLVCSANQPRNLNTLQDGF